MADIDTDSLASKIAAALGRAPKPQPDEDVGDLRGEGRASARIRDLIRERDEARAQTQALLPQIDELRGGFAAKLKEAQENAAKEVAAISSRHTEDLGLVEAGVRDPLGRQALRQAWEVQPKATRPESPAAWWAGIVAARDAHLAAPETAAMPVIPRTLLSYLPDPPKAADPPPKGQKAPPKSGAEKPKTNGSDPFAGLKADATMEDFFSRSS